MDPCPYEELVRRAKIAGIIPEDFSAVATAESVSSAEFVVGELSLPEKDLYKLLALEYSLDFIPLQLIEGMDIPEEFRTEEHLSVFRREGFAPVSANQASILVVLVYPFPRDAKSIIMDYFDRKIEISFCNDRNLGAILNRSVDIGEDTEFGDDGEHFLGVESDEDAFPGLYGESSAATLYDDDDPSDDTVPDIGRSRSMNGYIEDLGFMDMIQMMSNSRKTATIHIDSEKYGAVFLFFKEGQIIHCQTEYGDGAEGFYKIVDLEKGKFEVITGEADADQTIFGSTEGLLLEGFRRMDEQNA